MNKLFARCLVVLSLLSASFCYAQQSQQFNLAQLLKEGQLINYHPGDIQPLPDDARQAVSVTRIVWLKGINFSNGSIDVDIRGKNVFQQSFLGIAFHGIDTITYDCIYFRPFNFQSADSLRRKHTVQYISEPDYPWDKLRAEHPLVYENAVNPVPLSTEWFHAHIVISNEEVMVYVNHSATPSLTVKKLNNRNNGLIGLWSSNLSGDFSNLVLSPQAP
jgi:hypothetical protein